MLACILPLVSASSRGWEWEAMLCHSSTTTNRTAGHNNLLIQQKEMYAFSAQQLDSLTKCWVIYICLSIYRFKIEGTLQSYKWKSALEAWMLGISVCWNRGKLTEFHRQDRIQPDLIVWVISQFSHWIQGHEGQDIAVITCFGPA